jgi:hypothetical protein
MVKSLLFFSFLLLCIGCRQTETISITCSTVYTSIPEIRQQLSGKWRLQNYIEDCQITTPTQSKEWIFPDTTNSEDYILGKHYNIKFFEVIDNDTTELWGYIYIYDNPDDYNNFSFDDGHLSIVGNVKPVQLCDTELIYKKLSPTRCRNSIGKHSFHFIKIP